MTIDEMIAVLQAYKEGKTIQFLDATNDTWHDADDPCWDFFHNAYRVKPEPHYRPFKNAEEVMEAIKEHGEWLKIIFNGWRARLVGYSNERIDATGCHNAPFDEALEKYTFLDGTPFGVLEE